MLGTAKYSNRLHTQTVTRVSLSCVQLPNYTARDARKRNRIAGSGHAKTGPEVEYVGEEAADWTRPMVTFSRTGPAYTLARILMHSAQRSSYDHANRGHQNIRHSESDGGPTLSA